MDATVPPSADEAAAAARRVRRAKFCEVRLTAKMDGAEHKSRRGHDVRALTREEKDALLQQVVAEACGGADARKDRVARQQAEQRERHKTFPERAPEQPASGLSLCLTFGKHKGLAAGEVQRRDRGCLLHSVTSGIPDNISRR